ncbi:MAG: response regulator [Sedimentisphaerales bacterium]|nr:response regulator [Sedimentisphaerales bacterium]
MTFHALAVDDDPAILEDVKDRLEGLGHTCDCVTCMTCAREHLTGNTYSYILLDLQIPVRYGRKSRIPNGQSLLREIRSMKGYQDIPIIVMTTHGHDSPDLAVEVFRCDGATDFVKKPFPDDGHTLEKAVRDGLDASGRSRPGAVKRSGLATTDPPQPFECGEMVFSPSRVELCEVKICGGPESGMIRRILDELRHTNQHGRFVRYDGGELAKRIGCERGQNGVAEAVAAFRTHVCEVMHDEANVKIDRLHDIILNDRRYGYRLASKITVRDADEPAAPEPAATPRDPAAADDTELNPRQRWALDQLTKNGQLRKAEIVTEFHCSPTTAERDLRDLRRQGRIEFIGPAKTGHWRLARRRTSVSD